MPTTPLPPCEVHVWLASASILAGDPTLAANYHTLMTPEESARHRRFMFERNRNEFLLTRALARTVLSRYADVPPRDWRFAAGSHGKPDISSPSVPWLRFNLSNTEGLVACAVARDLELGVDVENIERSGETVDIADRFFAPLEVAELRSLPAHAQRDRFFDYWTLKESYIKARGLGLSIPLDQFAFLLGNPGPIRIQIDPRLEDDGESWQFTQLAPTPHHKVAVGVRRGRQGAPVTFQVHWTVPLQD